MLSRTPAAIKKRKQRKRRRDGLACYMVELPEQIVVEGLTALGWLTDRQALSHARQERALGRLYIEWCRRWRIED